MSQAVAAKDTNRLPWLEPYRPQATRRSAKLFPLGVLLGVVLTAGTAALLVPNDAPVEVAAAPQAQVDLPSPQVTAVEAPVEAPSVQIASAQPSRAVVRSTPARRVQPRSRERIVKAEPVRDAYEQILSEQIALATLSPAPAPAVAPVIAPQPLIVAPPEPVRPAVNPSAAVVRGQTVQLGVYLTQRQAEIAWRSAIRDYTFLVTMPKSITRVRYGAKRPFYRLQLGTPSKRHAKQLCRNLKSTGRNCTVA